jgi:GTP cyclohydrolase I
MEKSEQEKQKDQRRNNVKTYFRWLMETFHFYFDTDFDKESRENTPERLMKMYLDELLIGYSQNPKQILSKTFKAQSNDMIIVRNIQFTSLCAHHWLPFIGTCDIGYIPKNKTIVGLSKLPRLVQCYSRRFQVQENMTTEIADAINTYLKPKGCIVVTKASHLCSQIRGVQSKESEMIVSAIRGCFNEDKVKQEFFKMR